MGIKRSLKESSICFSLANMPSEKKMTETGIELIAVLRQAAFSNCPDITTLKNPIYRPEQTTFNPYKASKSAPPT